jgi:hypothetical protein
MQSALKICELDLVFLDFLELHLQVCQLLLLVVNLLLPLLELLLLRAQI